MLKNILVLLLVTTASLDAALMPLSKRQTGWTLNSIGYNGGMSKCQADFSFNR